MDNGFHEFSSTNIYKAHFRPENTSTISFCRHLDSDRPGAVRIPVNTNCLFTSHTALNNAQTTEKSEVRGRAGEVRRGGEARRGGYATRAHAGRQLECTDSVSAPAPPRLPIGTQLTQGANWLCTLSKRRNSFQKLPAGLPWVTSDICDATAPCTVLKEIKRNRTDKRAKRSQHQHGGAPTAAKRRERRVEKTNEKRSFS